MNGKGVMGLLLVLWGVAGLPGYCVGDDSKDDLIVNRIAFNRTTGGGERITLSCNRSCAPELFIIEEERPRVVMDMKGVLRVRTGPRRIDTGGKWVKRVRSHLDGETGVLRIVLDLEPTARFVVRPTQDRSGAAYALTIRQDDAEDGTASGKRIRLLPVERKAGQREGRPPKRASGEERRHSAQDEAHLLAQGRSQLNDARFSAAVETFTRFLAARPRESLGYRLRGNAYDNLGDRPKALEDWTQAARLGDSLVQSYLEFLEVAWQAIPAPENAVPVGGR